MPESQTKKSRKILQPVAMHDRYGPFLRSFFARYFSPICFPTDAIDCIQDLAKQGTIVYLARSANLLHFLYLNYVCLRHRLPLARFVNGVDPVLIQPIGLLMERMHTLSNSTEDDLEEEGDQLPHRQLASVLEAGQAGMLFLDKPSTITCPKENAHGFDNSDNLANTQNGLLQTLIDIQQRTTQPIYLIPHLIIWGPHPEKESKAITDAIFGLPESPGFLRMFFRLLRHYRKAIVKVAEPLDLRKFLQSQSDRNLTGLAASLQELLENRLSLEVFDVTGPKIRPHANFKRDILQDSKIEEFIHSHGQSDPARIEVLRKKAHDMLDEIAAEPRIRWPLTVNWFLNRFWNRMYDGIVVEGYEKIRTAVRKSPVALCPSHKSHVDYLILSHLCFRYAVPLPHIAAGINLSFWPMGPIFRHSGAFFMRRSFKGDKLYPVVFRTYLRHVMKDGYPIEFFIEGTRSRTGKLLTPRFGILSWLIQAYLEGTGEDLQFIPISIDYEKIVESRAYLKELSGEDKKKEDVASLVKSSKALKSKYGKVYVQVGDPISLKKLLSRYALEDATSSEDNRRALVQETAHRILFEINRVSTVTPSALVAFSLLTHRRRGMSQEALLHRAQWAADWIRSRGHERFSMMLSDFNRSLVEASARFSRDGLLTIHDTGFELVYSPVERRRLALDYYRNNIIHHFVPAAICMLALESFTVEACPLEALSGRIRDLSVLFKFEFLFRSERHFQEEVRQALNDLKTEGVLKEENGFVVKNPERQEQRRLFCAVLEHFVEAYWLSALTLATLTKGPLLEREFLSRALHIGDRLYAQGEMVLYESLNREVIKTALKSFANRGVVDISAQEGRRGSRLSLIAPWEKPDRLERLAQELRRYQPRI